MGSIINLIERQHKKQMKMQWYETYWLVDMHGVISRPHHGDWKLDFYPYALETLRLLTNRPDIRLILYTSSYPDQIEFYTKKLEELGVEFDYINENPEIGEGDIGCYDEKPYFDVYLDDKAGFDAANEWFEIFTWLREDKRPDERWRNPIRERRRTDYLLYWESVKDFAEVLKKDKNISENS